MQNAYPKNYKWYKDRPTFIALISGACSTTITIVNVFFG